MIRRKLTPSLKKKIKDDYKHLRLADFDGEALTYLRQVKGAAKGRAAKKKQAKEKKKAPKKEAPKEKARKESQAEIKVAGKIIKPGSKAYELISEGAKVKNQSIRKFVQENESAIEKMLKDFLIFYRKEIDDLIILIRSLHKSAKIYCPIKFKVISRPYAIFLLHAIKKAILETELTYEVIFIEYAFDLNGNIHFNCPRPSQYAELMGEELLEFVDDEYPNISYIRNDNDTTK